MNKNEFKEMLLECLKDEIFTAELTGLIFNCMTDIDLKIKKVDDRAEIPVYGSEGAAAFDLKCLLEEEDLTLTPGEVVSLHTGLAMAIPKGYVGIIAARSGLGCNKGLIPSNAIGVIDSDYRGEIKVALYNHSDKPQTIKDKERIAQMMIIPAIFANMFLVDDLDETERGDGGFGHSGRM